MTNTFTAYITADHVSLSDAEGELVHWDRQEWLDDPDLAVTIANAINVGYLAGGDAVWVMIHGDNFDDEEKIPGTSD